MLIALGALLLQSCAIGYDSPDGFDVGVHDTQLANPDSISFVVNSAGTKATVSWPLVLGAAGYEVTFRNVDDPDNPYIVDGYENFVVDGTSMTVTVAEDSKYEMEMRVLGNSEYNNQDAPEKKLISLSTLVQSVATIPSGSDIYQYMLEHPLDSTTLADEVAIDLEPKGEYTLSGPINFYGQKMTFRGDKVYRPTVNVTGKGSIASYAGLKVKYINFDMTESLADGLILMSADSLPDAILQQNLGYTRNGSLLKGVYIVQDPVYVAHCWFKNMPKSLINDNKVSCAWWDFTITDCIVQQNNSSNVGFICLQNSGRMIKNILIDKCTIYNIVDNSSAYFIRYANSSNSNPEKTFGNATSLYSSQSITFQNSTFSKVYTGQKFVNNINSNGMTTLVDHCIFYDICQTRRMSIGYKTFKFNFWYAFTKPDNNDPNQKDNSGAPFASVYDPQFAGNVLQELDFSKENGGVDFTPGEYEIIANRGGDPRWLPASSTTVTEE